MPRVQLVFAIVAVSAGCRSPAPASPARDDRHAAKKEATMTTLADDLAFLRKHGDPIVLRDASGAEVVLSAEYQGRVMTSGVAEGGRSLGFINHAFVDAGKTGTQFDNYGGEDRFWLGPEGGQFGLYFAPGAPFDFDHWQTPHEMQEGAWKIGAQDARSVTFEKSMHVVSWSKTPFDVDVRRTIRMLGKDDVKKHLGVTTDAALVAYESENRITNAGKEPWTKDKGLLSIWILAMYAPSADTRVVVPFENGDGPIVNDAYFGKVPSERLVVRPDQGVLFFRCDGTYRSKIGLGPKRAKGVLGSYSAAAKLLTIVAYDRGPADAPYVDSMWEMQKDPYAGDVVNSYNDGPPAPGKPSLGGFYELETSSPGLALAPGASGAHTHRTFHFVGEPAQLEPIARAVLGVPLGSLPFGPSAGLRPDLSEASSAF